MSLFQLGSFTLHSGEPSAYKIDCDALTDDDIKTVAFLMRGLRPFGRVEGVPRGGVRLADALRDLCSPDSSRVLIVDDVFTTGASMEQYRQRFPDAIGAVIFARKPTPPWIFALFSLNTPTP